MENTKLTITQGRKKDVKNGTILFEGELTYNEVDEIKKKITPTIQKYDELNIQLRNIENLDLTCIQLLFAFQKSFRALNKKLTFDIELPNDIKALIEHSGFSQIINI